MKNFEIIYEGNHIVAFNKILFKTFSHNYFDPDYLRFNQLLNQFDENIEGRGAVHYFTFDNIDLVLRHYHRGGLPAKFIKDHYMWLGLQKTRAISEINILSNLYEKNLPVPRPVAAHIHKIGAKYSADIVTVQISDSQTLGEILQHQPLKDHVWKEIGKTIRTFHDINCNHVDLNANNIMLDKHDVIYLIDFDRARIENGKGKWQEENIKRLRRSLDKYLEIYPDFNFYQKNFLSLMQGYQST